MSDNDDEPNIFRPTTGGGSRPTSSARLIEGLAAAGTPINKATSSGRAGIGFIGGGVSAGTVFLKKNFIHIWADTNANGFLSSWKPSLRGGTEDHCDKGDTLVHVSSISGLNRFFQQHLVHNKSKIDRLDFHTHGNSGFIALGSDHLYYKDIIEYFAKKGYENVFNSDARIFFHGCNVAEGSEGELFLALFGGIFLRQKGGRVGASTGAGYGLSWAWGPSSWHPTGNTVYAYVKPGGSTSLKNHSVLIPERIITRIKALELRVSTFNGERSTKMILQSLINKAKQEIAGGATALSRLFDAHKFILEAEKTLDRIKLAKPIYNLRPG